MKRTLLAMLALSAITASSMQAMSFFEEEEIENITPDTDNQYSNPKQQKSTKPLADQLEELESDSYTDMEIE